MDTAPAVETADPFADGADQDPFAGGDAGEPTADIPVVNADGEPVDAPAAETQPLPTPEIPAEGGPEEGGKPDPAPEEAAAAEPAQAAPDAAEEGKNPLRQYHLLYQTGEQQWTEAEWTEEGSDTPTRILKARNNEHALRLAFSVLGEPEAGVTVLPVPASSFKPKRLKRKPVVPRTALDITSS